MTSLASSALSADDDDNEPLVTAAIPSPSLDDGDPTPIYSMEDDDPLVPAFSKVTRTAIISTPNLPQRRQR